MTNYRLYGERGPRNHSNTRGTEILEENLADGLQVRAFQTHWVVALFARSCSSFVAGVNG
jgi:hypothetical protein